jgi:hypothetical protein
VQRRVDAVPGSVPTPRSRVQEASARVVIQAAPQILRERAQAVHDRAPITAGITDRFEHEPAGLLQRVWQFNVGEVDRTDLGCVRQGQHAVARDNMDSHSLLPPPLRHVGRSEPRADEHDIVPASDAWHGAWPPRIGDEAVGPDQFRGCPRCGGLPVAERHNRRVRRAARAIAERYPQPSSVHAQICDPGSDVLQRHT